MKKMSESDLWEMLKGKLKDQGIALENLLDIVANTKAEDVKIVCATMDDLGASLEELASSSRDQVLMVRVDEETLRKLNMWTETGAVKSKSEAAALFIKEGLKVRASELEELTDAIKAVEKAKAQLRSRAKHIFGDGGES